MTEVTAEKLYIEHLAACRLLNKDEELKLTRQYKQNPSQEIATRLTNSLARYIDSVARKKSGYGLNHLDLVQEGNVGCLKALKKFDPEVGVLLSTYAKHWINAEMHNFIFKNTQATNAITTKADRKLFFKLNKTWNKVQQKGQQYPNNDQISKIAEMNGVNTEDVQKMFGVLFNSAVCIDTLEDFGEKRDPIDILIKGDQKHSLVNSALEEMKNLKPRDKTVLEKRTLIDKEDRATLQDLADDFDVSAERIRQIEKGALGKLKAHLETKFPDFNSTDLNTESSDEMVLVYPSPNN